MDMFVLFLLSTFFTVCVGHTCPAGSGTVDCRDDQYCCDGCCDSKGFLALYVIAAIGAVPIAILAVYVIILLIKMCCKRGEPVAPLDEVKSASGSKADIISQDGDNSNSEKTKEPSKSESKEQTPTGKTESSQGQGSKSESNAESSEKSQVSTSGHQPEITKTGSSDGGTNPPSEEVLYKGNKEVIVSMPPSSPSGSTSHA